MTNINLLPHREWERQEKKRDYGVLLGLGVMLAAAIVGLVYFQMNAKIDYQLSRNKYIQSEIGNLDKQIAEISDLKKVRRNLLERMEVIQALQGSRPSIVHLFTEIVSTVPNGVYLKSLLQTGTNLVMNGQAESNARVSTYMRNLDKSDWLKEPILSVIEVEDIKVDRISTFTLTVKQTSPNATDEDDVDDGGVQ